MEFPLYLWLCVDLAEVDPRVRRPDLGYGEAPAVGTLGGLDLIIKSLHQSVLLNSNYKSSQILSCLLFLGFVGQIGYLTLTLLSPVNFVQPELRT